MNSSPHLATDPTPTVLQLPKVSEQEDGPGHFPALYPSPLDRGTVCIPSPFADTEFGPGSLALGPPVSDNPIVGPPLSPSLFWPSHSAHTHTLHCPPQLVYGEPHTHAAWSESKPHTPRHSSSLLPHMKLLGKQVEEVDGVLDSSLGVITKSDLHFCVVCSDYASGYHYGVWSCEGCKAFFKRSIQGHNDYICPATNQCTIDKNRRKSCQSCRLRKCYEVGMMKCGVRRERCSYRGARHRRAPHIRDGAGTDVRLRGHSQRRQQPQLHLSFFPQGSDGRRFCMSPEQLVHCMLDAEPPQIYLKQQMKKPYTESGVMMSLTNLADKELVFMISWAKKIPGFVELNLPLQVQLLGCCWLEVLMLGLMWRSVDHPGNLIFSPDLKLSRDEGSCVEGIMEIFDMLLAGSSRFRELKLQKEEYVCLKALILLNSNMTSPEAEPELESRSKLLRLLDTVTDALVWAISRTGLSPQQQSARLAHLLMLLSHIRHLSNKGIVHLSDMKRKNVVLLYDLLLEMLDANTSHMSGALCSDPEYSPPKDTCTQSHTQSSLPGQVQGSVAQQLAQNLEKRSDHE
ncbi:estrogen receptor 2b [Hoplias malabaricus]|uniref:estrogen receptor 2b n=1 Tax=Hoplias malabaricus TaxID=27720 RepID=UPI003461EF9C